MTEMDLDDTFGNVEKSRPVGLVVSNQTGVKLEHMLSLTEWPTDPIPKMCRIILNRLEQDNYQDDVNSDDSRLTPCSIKATTVIHERKSMQVYRILWMTTQQCFKPSVISNLLCISRQKVYDTLRKARNEQKRMKRRTNLSWVIPHPSRGDAIQKAQAFVKENAHNFFSWEDVRRDIGTIYGNSGYPSTSTVRSILKRDWGLSFKKVNLRYKPKWTRQDLAVKTRHVWLMTWMMTNGWKTVHIDEFNISSTSINCMLGHRKEAKITDSHESEEIKLTEFWLLVRLVQ